MRNLDEYHGVSLKTPSPLFKVHPSRCILLCAFFVLSAIGLFAQSAAPYQEVWYKSGKLRIQAYLYTPAGTGPFPVIIYNHGSRPPGNERLYSPMTAVAQMLVASGYMVFEPARRGYGKSDGQPAGEVIGTSRGDAYIRRLWEEVDDILAAEEFLKTIHSADRKRIGMIGYSQGGILTIFAASREPGRFACLVDQAGGASSWGRSPQLQAALRMAAARLREPILAMVAENDHTTASVRAVVEEAQKVHNVARLIIYPPYTPPAEETPPGGRALGHGIFRDHGIPIWENDVRTFLAGCLQHPAIPK